MRDELDPPRVLDLPPRTAARRRRLHKGAKRWWRDVNNDGRKVHRVLLWALTVADPEMGAVEGAVRALMKQLRDVSPGLRYLWWLELQARGALHYHGVYVDPPFEFERDARKWFDDRWPHAQIQTDVEWKSGRWFSQNEADYVLKDVGKGKRKGYQQWYETVPLGWRTFGTSRLTFTADEHRPHEDRTFIAYSPGQAEPLKAVAVDVHCPAEGGCRLVRYDRLRRRRVLTRRPGRPARRPSPAPRR